MRRIAITPNKCTGCSTCVLTCAITYQNDFEFKVSHIQITKADFAGLFTISFSSTCRNCCKCAELCPSQCLVVVELPESNRGR